MSDINPTRRAQGAGGRAMWSLGWSDAQIARTIGVAPASIGSARKRMRLTPNYSGRGCLK